MTVHVVFIKDRLGAAVEPSLSTPWVNHGLVFSFVGHTAAIETNVNQFVVERRYEPRRGAITSVHLARVNDYDELDISTWKCYFFG